MSLKTDAILIGGVAVGGYLLITHLDDILAWVGGEFNKAANPIGAAIGEKQPFVGDLAAAAYQTQGLPISLLNPNEPIGGVILSQAVAIGGSFNQATPSEILNVQTFVGTLIGNVQRSIGALFGW